MSTSNENTTSFTVNGQTYQTWYRVYGDLSTRTRTPLVALHGGPGLVSDYLVPLQGLATSYDIPVIIYDQIGNGRSSHIRDRADSPSFWSLDLFLDELNNLLLHLGIQDRFDLWGHSWGGILSLEYTIRQKSTGLKHLILSDSLPSVELWGQSSMQLLQKFPEDVQEGMMKGMANPTKYLDALKKFHAVHGCTVVPMPEEVVRTLEGVFGGDGDPSVALALMQPSSWFSTWSAIDRLHQIDIPTLVINGANDISQDFVVEPMVEKIPGAKWVKFQESSHMPFWEESGKYTRVIADFVEV